MNFAMLPKYYISIILLMYSISAIFSHIWSIWKPKLLLRLWLRQILCTIPYDTQLSDCIKQSAIFRPLCNYPNKPVYNVTFTIRFCVRMMAACKQGHGFWLPILVTRVCAEFHVMRFFIALKYCLSTVVLVLQNTGIGYQQWKINIYIHL